MLFETSKYVKRDRIYMRTWLTWKIKRRIIQNIKIYMFQWIIVFKLRRKFYFNIYNGTFITGTFLPDNFLTDPFTNGQYERLVYDSMNHLFYQKFSGSLDTSSLMFNTNTYQSASEQRPTGAYFDYNTNPLLVKNFPTESGAKIRVLSVDQDIYGSKVLPNSFRLSSSVYDITDDGNGNLYNTGSVHIGNIFYAQIIRFSRL